MTVALLRRAVKHFPRGLPHADHNRRAWLRSVAILRERNLWLLDARVERKTTR